MTGMHKCLFCGTEIAIVHQRGRIPEYCSEPCRNARKYLNAFLREIKSIDMAKAGPDIRSELFMIANTIVKAKNCHKKSTPPAVPATDAVTA